MQLDPAHHQKNLDFSRVKYKNIVLMLLCAFSSTFNTSNCWEFYIFFKVTFLCSSRLSINGLPYITSNRKWRTDEEAGLSSRSFIDNCLHLTMHSTNTAPGWKLLSSQLKYEVYHSQLYLHNKQMLEGFPKVTSSCNFIKITAPQTEWLL